jgi:PAS domain S-box-containing protein
VNRETFAIALEGDEPGLWNWEIPTGRAWYDERWCKILGYAPEVAAADVGFRDGLIHPEDRDRVGARLADHLSGKTLCHRGELRFRTQAGDWIWGLEAVKVVDRGRDGTPLFATGALVDITTRKRAEDVLRTLSGAVEQTADSVVITNRDGIIEYVNPAYELLTGYSRFDVIGQTPKILKSGRHPAEFYEELWRTLLAGGVFRAEFTNRRKSGELYFQDETIAPVKDADGLITHFISTGRDVTERKGLHEQLLVSQRMEALGRLAGGVAHDFNNVLTAIMGYAEIGLLSAPPEASLREDLGEIISSARRAAELTRQLLAFARKQVVAPRVVVLNEVVLSMGKLLRRLLGEDVDLVIFPHLDLWPVLIDPGQMEQVIVNCAVNARDAMPHGGRLTIELANVTLEETYLRRHQGARGGEYVLLAVTDTGVGMTREVMEHVFEPFFTTKERGKGTGLGLSTSYGIVKQADGFIWVYSEPGRGSTFKVYLPRSLETPAALPAPTPRETASLGEETILLVEDDLQIREVVTRALVKQGYVVLVTGSAEEALDLVVHHDRPINLVVTDLVLPRMDGHDLAERIRQLVPGIRVLFVSGYPERTLVHGGELEPGAAFLAKPFAPAELARRVRELLDRTD